MRRQTLWFSLSLGFVILFALIGTTSAASSSALLTQDFDQVAVGELPEGWLPRNGDKKIFEVFEVVEDPTGARGKVLKQSPGMSGEGYLLTPPIAAHGSEVTVQFRVRIDATDGQSGNVGFYLFTEGGQWPPYTSLHLSPISDQPGRAQLSAVGTYDGALQSKVLFALDLGEFHDIALRINLDDSKYRVSVNGGEWSELLNFRSPGTSLSPFHLGLYWREDKPVIYWDEISVSE